MTNQKGGGSVGQSLRYMDLSAPEQTASEGRNLLVEDQAHLIARQAIGGGTRKRKGGFFPSVMSGVVNAGMVTGPLVALTARRMLSRKNHKGGGKKGNIWKRNKAEAKSILQAYGKPTAMNIQQYAVAKRKGTEKGEEYLEGFRKRKQEQQEALQAKKAAVQRRKNERAAKKAAKAATKKQRKPRVAKPTNSERAPTQAQLLRQAKANAAAAKKATKKNKAPKATMNAAWMTFVENAKQRLQEYNGTKRNINKLASLLKEGKNTETFMNNLRTRKATQHFKKVNKATKKNKAPAPTPVPAPAPTTTTTTTTTAAPTTARAASNAQKKYFQALRDARTYLGTIGAPLGENMSKYASMKSKGMNTTAWEENFKTRRPLTMAPAPKPTTTTTTTTTAAPAKKNKNTTAKVNKTNKSKTAKANKPKNNKPKTAKANKPKTNKPTTAKAAKATTTTTTAATTTTAVKRAPSNSQKKYFDALREARTYLGTIGAPRGENMSKYVSLKLKGENTKAWEENFKTRRPLTMATTKKTKPKAAPAPAPAPAPKPLTAVKEENENKNNNNNNENEMQGYSENFESEPSNGSNTELETEEE